MVEYVLGKDETTVRFPSGSSKFMSEETKQEVEQPVGGCALESDEPVEPKPQEPEYADKHINGRCCK